jgi:hypothetical protein
MKLTSALVVASLLLLLCAAGLTAARRVPLQGERIVLANSSTSPAAAHQASKGAKVLPVGQCLSSCKLHLMQPGHDHVFRTKAVRRHPVQVAK